MASSYLGLLLITRRLQWLSCVPLLHYKFCLKEEFTEGFQRAIGKPFGRGRSREISFETSSYEARLLRSPCFVVRITVSGKVRDSHPVPMARRATKNPSRSHVSVQMRRLFICPPNYKKKRFRRQRRKPPYFFPKLLNIFFTLPWIVSSFRCSITAASAALLNTLLSGHSLIACRNDWCALSYCSMAISTRPCM